MRVAPRRVPLPICTGLSIVTTLPECVEKALHIASRPHARPRYGMTRRYTGCSTAGLTWMQLKLNVELHSVLMLCLLDMKSQLFTSMFVFARLDALLRRLPVLTLTGDSDGGGAV